MRLLLSPFIHSLPVHLFIALTTTTTTTTTTTAHNSRWQSCVTLLPRLIETSAVSDKHVAFCAPHVKRPIQGGGTVLHALVASADAHSIEQSNEFFRFSSVRLLVIAVLF